MPLSDKTEFTLKKLTVYLVRKCDPLVAAHNYDLGLFYRDAAEVLKATVTIAMQEEELTKYPSDWWQALKERWFPKWMKQRWPIKYNEVWAYHKFPDLEIPESLLGREKVSVRIISPEELVGKMLVE